MRSVMHCASDDLWKYCRLDQRSVATIEERARVPAYGGVGNKAEGDLLEPRRVRPLVQRALNSLEFLSMSSDAEAPQTERRILQIVPSADYSAVYFDLDTGEPWVDN